MIAFRLDDFKDQPLREAGVQLGIPNAANLGKDDLIRGIKTKISPNAAIVFVPMFGSLGDPRSSDRWTRVISVLALVVAIASACAAYWGVVAALNKNNSDQEEKTKESWQAVTVYEIIERGTAEKDKWGGLTFDEIKSKYAEEVGAAKYARLGKEDLQPEALKRILVGMIETGLLYRTIDDRFVVQRTVVNPRENLLQLFSTPNCGRIILKLLATDSGKYTVDKLAVKMNADFKIDSEEYWATINLLKAQGMITVDADDRVWSAVSPPKKK